MIDHWELCKKLKFDHKNKWYMYNSESFLENEKHKILCDFEIQTDYLISARQQISDSQQKKRTCEIVDFAVAADYRVKLKESEKTDKYQDLARELKKTIKYENYGDTNCNRCTWYSHQGIDAGTGGLRKRMSEDHPNNSIIKINQDTEKNPGDSRICCHSDSSENLSANTGVKNSQMGKMISVDSKLAPKEYKTRHNWVGKVLFTQPLRSGRI